MPPRVTKYTIHTRDNKIFNWCVPKREGKMTIGYITEDDQFIPNAQIQFKESQRQTYATNRITSYTKVIKKYKRK